MAFDGAFLYKTVNELKTACDSHIDKIYQPSRDELVFLLRKKGFAKRLLITVKPGCARMHFTENKYENPASPPNFCMLLRKYLTSAKLTYIAQSGFERVAELWFSAVNEMGDSRTLKLVCEFIGNQTNVILVNEDGKIIDSMKHSDVESAKRYILPGAVYEYPPSTEKHDPLLFNDSDLREILQSKGELSKTLLGYFEGFSPLVCREIQFTAENLIAAGETREGAITKALTEVLASLKSTGRACIVCRPDGTLFEFSYIDIRQYGKDYPRHYPDSFSQLLDDFYSKKDTAARIQAAAHDIVKAVTNMKARIQKKLNLRLGELKSCENREKFRIWGELLKANLYNIEHGASFAEVQNYYDENLSFIRIPLDSALSPARNAEKYFKEYRKTYTAEQTLTKLTEKDREEIVYLDSVLDSISRCTTLADLGEIRRELTEAGYIKNTQVSKRERKEQFSFKEYTSSEGYRIIVGKNNIQNDYITLRLASKNDLWFHVKNIPGSHVVVFCDGSEVSDKTILQAAELAAVNSKAANSSQVPVDYTKIKNVKKPSGAKPGMVIYTTNKTVFVNPADSQPKY